MKKYSVISLVALIALLLSSCSMHLGVRKLLNLNGGSPQHIKTKHIKATHTPPSPPTVIPAAIGTPMLTPPAENAVTITSAGYGPNNLQVKVGSAVTWTNTDNAAHTVTSDTAGIFDSGPIVPEATFTFTFNQAGVFAYHSTSDPSFAGSVIVIQ